MDNNLYIRLAAAECRNNRTLENMIMLAEVLKKRMEEDGTVFTPMIDKNIADTMQDGVGRLYFPLFTSEEELDKGETARICMQVPIRMILENGLRSSRAEGVVIDPFGEPLVLPKKLLEMILGQKRPAIPKGGFH